MLIIVSTMLLRWHYAVDVVAGLSLASAAGWLAPRLEAWEERRRAQWGFAAPWCFGGGGAERLDRSPST